MVGKMNKRRVCTTISARHWELLKKYTAKFETQQKALEFALESLENDTRRNTTLPPEDQLWVLTGKGTESACILHRDAFKTLLEGADVKRIIKIVTNRKIAEHMISWYYQKPLKKCSLEEVLDGVIFFLKAARVADTVNYVDSGNYYTLKMIHGLDIRTSQMFIIFIGSLFEAYGLKTESEISEKSLFMKIYKNL
jgi:hypothetical protein